MEFSRRRALATALSAFVAGPAWAAGAPLEAQGGQYSSFDGAQLFYRRMGSGPPVVLLHSFLNDGPRTWFNTGIAQVLVQAGFSVVAPDCRALGLSAAPAGAYPKDVLAMDVEALIRALRLKPFRLFGYAMGSRTALRLLARGWKPERCVLGGTGIQGAVDVERLAAANIETIRTGRNARDPRLGVRVTSAIRLQKLKPDALIAVLRSQVSTTRAALAQIRTPVLVLDGDKDTVEGSPAELAALIPDAAVMHVPGDHFEALRDPRFAQIAAAFLKSKDPPARFAASAALQL
jgi:pimeloyl-ACP methyl ester carboxylesterase